MKIHFQILVFPLVIIGNYSYAQIQNNGNLRMHSESSVAIFGDFTNNGSFTDNSGTLYAVGTNAQIFNGTHLIHANNFIINKSGGTFQLDNELQISGILTFNNGIVYSDHADKTTEFVHFLDGSSHEEASNLSHVDGVVRKTGNDAFTFPVGDDNNYQPISIDAPSLTTDAFTAEYFEEDPDFNYDRTLKEETIDHISSCEYWILDRSIGSSDVNVTLTWDENSCGVDDLEALLVTRWNDSKWINHGNGLITGNTAAGTITTSEAVISFSPFTLGSTIGNNPLPINLTYFEAKPDYGKVILTWETASEINNDYFTVERSRDGIDFEPLSITSGAGNSDQPIEYSTIDDCPLSGVSYYRLKQTDFDGNFKYSQVVSVEIETYENDNWCTLYPNPTTCDYINIRLPAIKEATILRISDFLGKVVYARTIDPCEAMDLTILPESNLLPGNYIVSLANNHQQWSGELIIK